MCGTDPFCVCRASVRLWKMAQPLPAQLRPHHCARQPGRALHQAEGIGIAGSIQTARITMLACPRFMRRYVAQGTLWVELVNST